MVASRLSEALVASGDAGEAEAVQGDRDRRRDTKATTWSYLESEIPTCNFQPGRSRTYSNHRLCSTREGGCFGCNRSLGRAWRPDAGRICCGVARGRLGGPTLGRRAGVRRRGGHREWRRDNGAAACQDRGTGGQASDGGPSDASSWC